MWSSHIMFNLKAVGASKTENMIRNKYAYLGNPFGKNFDATREKTGFL